MTQSQCEMNPMITSTYILILHVRFRRFFVKSGLIVHFQSPIIIMTIPKDLMNLIPRTPGPSVISNKLLFRTLTLRLCLLAQDENPWLSALLSPTVVFLDAVPLAPPHS